MDTNHLILPPLDETRSKKDERQRLAYYVEWLNQTDRVWYLPDLDAYRNYLIETRKLKPSSAKAHISTVKSRYKNLFLDQPELHKLLQQAVVEETEQIQVIEEAMKAISKSTTREAGQVEVERDIKLTHLSPQQIDQLLAQPDISTRQGLRDIVAIGMMYCTGITETELCSLQVEDLYHKKDGMSAVHVPLTPGGKERLAPWRDGLLFNEEWLGRFLTRLISVMDIRDGLVFRGFFRGGKSSTERSGRKEVCKKCLRAMASSMKMEIKFP